MLPPVRVTPGERRAQAAVRRCPVALRGARPRPAPGTARRAQPPASFAGSPHPRGCASVALWLPAGRGHPPGPGPGRGDPEWGGGAFGQSLNPPRWDDWVGRTLSPNPSTPPAPDLPSFQKGLARELNQGAKVSLLPSPVQWNFLQF